MKKITKNRGLVLKTSDYKENAVIATILTQTGKKQYIIRGAKKLTSSTHALAQIVTQLSFSATENFAINTMTEGSITDYYSTIKEDDLKMQTIYAIFEKVLLFSESVGDNATYFQFILQILDILKLTKYPHLILAIFELKLMYILGIAPEWKQCIVCKDETTDGVFSVIAGGILCSRCGALEGYELSVDETKALKYLYFIKLPKIDDAFCEQLLPFMMHIPDVIDLYYAQYFDFQSKAKAILKKIS